MHKHKSAEVRTFLNERLNEELQDPDFTYEESSDDDEEEDDIDEEEDVVILRQVQMFFWPWEDDEEFEEMGPPGDAGDALT